VKVDDIRALAKGPNVVCEGFNGALAITNEFISSQSIAYGEGDTNCNAIFGAVRNLEVASSSAADTADGTGLRTLLVIGADANGNYQEEVITMNGQTSVVGTLGFRTVYSAIGLTFGSGLANAGNIHIALRKSGGCTNTSGVLTAPTPAIVIAAGVNFDTQALWVCPANKVFKLRKIAFHACAQPVRATLLVRPSELKTWIVRDILPIGNVGYWEIAYPLVLHGGDAIRFDALSTTAAGQVNVRAYLDEVFGR